MLHLKAHYNYPQATWQPYLLSAILPQDEDPEAAREEEENRHEDVQRGQGHLTCGQGFQFYSLLI